ncbi:MAG: hypothetical protein KTR31_26560 [Myxococcales bacterium]|nr:hypothetical protein [Myxococcales bacterium]
MVLVFGVLVAPQGCSPGSAVEAAEDEVDRAPQVIDHSSDGSEEYFEGLRTVARNAPLLSLIAWIDVDRPEVRTSLASAVLVERPEVAVGLLAPLLDDERLISVRRGCTQGATLPVREYMIDRFCGVLRRTAAPDVEMLLADKAPGVDCSTRRDWTPAWKVEPDGTWTPYW